MVHAARVTRLLREWSRLHPTGQRTPAVGGSRSSSGAVRRYGGRVSQPGRALLAHGPPEEDTSLFRRSKTAEPPTPAVVVKDGGKGRPTPTRKEAQAAAKARAR